MRRSKVSAVEWRDVTDATDGAGVLVAVRQSKTNPDGDTADLRYLKNGAARAVRTLRAHRTPAGATGPAPTARVVPLTGQQIGQRFTAAAAAAGIARRVTAHSGRVGLASELTARGASHDRGDARRELENRPHDGPLQRLGHRRPRGPWPRICSGRTAQPQACSARTSTARHGEKVGRKEGESSGKVR